MRIWMPHLYGNPNRLHCIDDAGDKFVYQGDPRGKELWAEEPRDLSVRGEVYVKANRVETYRLDDNTGEENGVIDVSRVSTGTVLVSQLVPGQDGNLYVFTWNKGLWRLDWIAMESQKYWDGLDTHSLQIEGMMCFQLRHLASRPYAPTSEVNVIASSDCLTRNPKDAGKFLMLNAIGQGGKTKRTLIWQFLTARFHGWMPNTWAIIVGSWITRMLREHGQYVRRSRMLLDFTTCSVMLGKGLPMHMIKRRIATRSVLTHS